MDRSSSNFDVPCMDPFCGNRRRHLVSSGKCRPAKSAFAATPSDPRWPDAFAKLKSQYASAMLLFRAGDFYELFFDDAERAAELLNLTVTTRRTGTGQKPMAMCGFPHHSLESHLKTLVAAGERVAVCDPVETSSKAKGA